MTHPAKRELAIHNRLKEKLAELYPHETEESLADTLEGETDLNEKLAAVTRSALYDTALADGASMRAEEIKARITRLEHRAAQKRALVQEIMEQAGLKKIEAPDMTISLRACPERLVVTDENQIPGEYWMPQPSKLAKKDLATMLSKGKTVPGAHLSNQPPTLSVRTK